MNLNISDMESMLYAEREINSRMSRPTESAPPNGANPFPKDVPLAMAYVPFQQWGNTEPPENAFRNGTLFSDLIFPFREVGE